MNGAPIAMQEEIRDRKVERCMVNTQGEVVCNANQTQPVDAYGQPVIRFPVKEGYMNDISMIQTFAIADSLNSQFKMSFLPW